MKRFIGIIVWFAFSLHSPSVASEPTCTYINEADPHSKIWLEEDGTVVAKRFETEIRYPQSMGSGTGIMTRIYKSDDLDQPEQPMLFFDLSEIAKPGAPQGLIAAFGNIYLEECRQ